MSFYLAGAAWRAKVAPTTKLVLLCLADTANDDGECWPSLQTIANKTGLTRRAVINHVNILCRAGFLTKKIRHKKNGEQTSSLLKIVAMPTAGSEQDSLGVVNEVHGGSERGSLGVVNEVHPGSERRSPEPIKEPISLEPIKRKSTQKKISGHGPEEEINLPEWVPTEAWARFEEMRRKIKQQITPDAKALLIKKLDKMRKDGHDIEEILNESVVNNWRGVFAPRGKPNTETRRPSSQIVGGYVVK